MIIKYLQTLYQLMTTISNYIKLKNDKTTISTIKCYTDNQLLSC